MYGDQIPDFLRVMKHHVASIVVTLYYILVFERWVYSDVIISFFDAFIIPNMFATIIFELLMMYRNDFLKNIMHNNLKLFS